MSSRLTDEEVWLKYHLLALEWAEYSNNSAGLDCTAEAEADNRLAEFRKRFPADKAAEADTELVVEWEDRMFASSAVAYQWVLYVLDHSPDLWSWSLEKDGRRVSGESCRDRAEAKAAAEAALRKEIGA